MEQSPERTRLRAAAMRDEARNLDGARTLWALFSYIALPLFTAALGFFGPALLDASTYLAVAVWLFVVAAAAVAYRNHAFSAESAITLSLDNEDMEREIEALDEYSSDLEGVIQHKDATIVYAQNSLNYLKVVSARMPLDSPEAILEGIDETLSFLHLNGEEIFGFSPGERWNFALYLHSRDTDRLTPVWRKRSALHPSSGMGREWGRGQGHVGKAFVDRRAKITGNANHPDVAALMGSPPGLGMSYDKDAYQSYASFPIFRNTLEEDAFGVLVATSDQKARFSRENTGILWQAAETIATLLTLADVTQDAIIERKREAGGENGEAIEGMA